MSTENVSRMAGSFARALRASDNHAHRRTRKHRAELERRLLGEVQSSATAEGITVNEWLRRAVARELTLRALFAGHLAEDQPAEKDRAA